MQSDKNNETVSALRVNMFGGFSMAYAGRKVGFARSSNTKFIQLLQLLFLHCEDGISKKELIDTLYGWESGVNPNKNLNNVIYRLKKQLVAAGLPEEDYIVLENGMCRWKSSFPVEVDTALFEACVRKAEDGEAEQRVRMMKEAQLLYTGEFLPEFSNELWVIEKNQHYKKLYEDITMRLGEYLKQSGDYQQELRLYKKAEKIYPYDEWQTREIDCLLQLKEYKEAHDIYQNTVRLYCEDMGVPPGQEMVNRLRQIERQVTNPVGSFEDIRNNFREKQDEGAYYCLYPSFLDSCRLLARMAERSGSSIFLMLLSLTEKREKEYTEREKLEEQMALLKAIVGKTLRKGDLYTRYSKSQFLIILIGTEQENCNKVFTRFLNTWKNWEGAKGELSYSAESLIKMITPEIVHQDKKPAWGKTEKLWG